MKGMATCKVCGRDFALMIEEHYVVRDPKKAGVITALVDSDKAYEYDAFDCPHCGCQYVAQERKPLAVAFEEYPSSDEVEKDYEDKYTGCDGCKYDYCGADEEPCNSCRHCRLNLEESKFVPKEDK